VGTKQTDMTSGFELFARQTLEMILAKGIQSRAHFFQTEIKTFCRKLHFVEVPIHYRAPSPRLKSSAVGDAFKNLWRLRQMSKAGEV
jgi:dolichol-phosphate mannosyltransferase